jgi:ERCC4-related helicase
MDSPNTFQPPEIGQVVSVRKKRFTVIDIQENTADSSVINDVLISSMHLVHLSSIEDDDLGNEIAVIWQVEPGVKIEEKVQLPSPRRFDPPEKLEAFMNAVRWGAISSTDIQQLQAPFRSGIDIEDYQLEPLIRALQMPRANLLIADDVGLGKTIEAGLIVQELLFRNRAHSILVVCPAGLQIHWRDQMWDKFGLEFRMVDSEYLRLLRRKRGIHVNPWSHFPRLITSIDFLKRDYPLRLFKELLPSQITYPRKFDVLIIDEAHNVAPSGSGQYAVESQRTQAIRSIASHFEHRLFLSATPHNGYLESFTSLLDLLDNQRFARGVKPNPGQLEQVMVRRLKTELLNWNGSPRFPERIITPINVPYTEEEKQVHELLKQYCELRILNYASRADQFAVEFVLKLLKKRLFSSPAAFASTLEKHLQTLQKQKTARNEKPSIGILRRQIMKVEETFSDDEEFEEEVSNAVTTASNSQEALSGEEQAVIRQLQSWGEKAGGRADSKAKELIKWLESTLKTGGEWNDERVIIFTEYRATQNYLQLILSAHGFTQGGRLMALFGGMDIEEREQIKAAFQSHPALSPVRILLATDTASEGIDLQNFCHRLVHYEIPWNPNRMEQRNGRIDRHGQKHAPEVYHFVGASLEQYSRDDQGTLEADLEFLWVAVKKVEQIREDLGNVGPVIAASVEKAMLGQIRTLDTSIAEQKAQEIRRLTRFQADQKKKTREYMERLKESRLNLNLSPENTRIVVETALALAEQPPLIPARDVEGVEGQAYYLPALKGSWRNCMLGLGHPFTGVIRPIVFDSEFAKDRDDVVLAHLNHRLVQMSLRLLRAEVWTPDTEKGLSRVSIRSVANDLLDTPAAMAYGRLVVIGGDNQRLHEELITAGGEIREGRFRRIEQVGRVQSLLDASQPQPVPATLQTRLQEIWPGIESNLMLALEARMKQRLDGMQRLLDDRQAKEIEDITALLHELETAIEAELKTPGPIQLELWKDEERDQLRRDEEALSFRLNQIPGELEKEVNTIKAHYVDPQPRMYPVAVVFLVPERMVV